MKTGGRGSRAKKEKTGGESKKGGRFLRKKKDGKRRRYVFRPLAARGPYEGGAKRGEGGGEKKPKKEGKGENGKLSLPLSKIEYRKECDRIIHEKGTEKAAEKPIGERGNRRQKSQTNWLTWKGSSEVGNGGVQHHE